MDRHEEAVMQLLTANGETFVAPKYEVADGWQCPAFVALRPARRQVYVVEVSASGYPLALVNRLNERVEKWYAPLLSQLHGLGITQPDWEIACLVFVRSDQIDWLKERIKDLSGVHVLGLEQAMAYAQALRAQAHAALQASALPDTRALAALADMVVGRSH